MKPESRKLLFPIFFSATLAALDFASATTYTWDGGISAGTANWGNTAMWDGDPTPVFDNTADIIFYKTGTTLNLTNAINGDRTVRSITFNADADTTVNVRTRQAVGAGQPGRILTFDADTGNATITVDAGSSANHVINGGTVNSGFAGGSIVLTDSLDVTHNNSATTLTMGQVNDGTNANSETPITGPGGINKSGVGVLVLAGPNLFAGGVNISAGRVHVQSNDALGTGGVTLSGTDAELRLSTTGVVTPAANTLTVSDTGDRKVLQGLVAGGATTFSGAITINETTAGNFELAAGSTHTFTITGNISGTTAAGIKKTSSGIVILAGTNGYTGETLVSNGKLKVGSASAIPSGTGKGNVNVSSGTTFGGILDLNGNDLTVNGLIGGSAATLGQIVNDGTGSKTLTVGAGDIPATTTYTYSGLIKDNSGTGGAVAFKKIGAGIQNLSGANTFTGGVTIEEGALELGNNLAAAANTITLSAPATEGAAADLRFLGSGNLTISNPLVISDAGQVKRLRKFGTGTAVYAGSITVNETTEGLFEIQVGTTNTLTITGDISDTGTAGIKKINPGVLILQGAKSYTGPTIIIGGTLTLDTAYLDDASSVKIGTGAILNLTHGGTDTVDKLFINGVQQAAGLYRATDANGGSGLGTPIDSITGSGKLDVTTSPVVDPYVVWASQIPNEADRDREDDPDTDGFTNLEEYLFGTSPVISTGTLSATERSGGNLIIRWKELVTGATYTLEESTTLANDWVTATGATLENDGTASGGYQPRKATVTIAPGKKFFHVNGMEQ